MSHLNVDNVANKLVAPLSVDEVVRVSHKCKIPPFGHKVIHGSVGLVLQGYRMNVMTHGLEKRLPLLPLGVDVQSAYAILAAGSNRQKHDMGHTKVTKHKIVLKDPDTPPFKERFCRIPPPQLDEVREHLKLMLDAGVVRLSNSPWCNAVVLVRKKDGSLRFCIDFRRLNALTIKDSHPLLAFARLWRV